jgi:deazaflavin-dependent oxidoreductase (nitroreductase family)
MEEEVFDNPTSWVATHIARYVETDGRRGHTFMGMDSLLITTRGRRSGKLRRTALYYGVDAGRYVVIASNAGADRHPDWYLNLVAEPEVRVQVLADRFAARARTATAGERPRLWALMAGLNPAFEDYRLKTERELPVVILERVTG